MFGFDLSTKDCCMPFRRRVLPTALALAVLVAGCGAKEDQKVQVKTGPGVTDDTISLGVLTDLTGPFKASALTRMKGYELYLKQINDVRLLTAKLSLLIENQIRKYPGQWLWIHKRWKTRPPGEPPIY